MLPNHIRVVTTATNAELLSEPYYSRLWIAVKNVEISRREWLEELANLFRDNEVELTYPSGRAFEIPDVDDVFEDAEMRWLSFYLKDDGSGKKPKAKSRSLDRVRLLDLYFRVKHPSIAAHFGR